MTGLAGEGWLDGDAARAVRPYTVARGRTSPSTPLDLMTMIVATGSGPRARLEPDHEHALGLCRAPATVAEVAARLRLPVMVAKVLLSDLADCGAVRAVPPLTAAEATDRALLERVLVGLRDRL
jgi:uncharacterized protein DUF742